MISNRCPRCSSKLSNKGNLSRWWYACTACKEYEEKVVDGQVVRKRINFEWQEQKIEINIVGETSFIYIKETDSDCWKITASFNQILPDNISFDRLKTLMLFI